VTEQEFANHKERKERKEGNLGEDSSHPQGDRARLPNRLSLSLDSLRSLWLSCTGPEIVASWHLCAFALPQLAESGNGTTKPQDWRRERARLPRRAETAGLMEFDPTARAAYSFCMNAVEFTTELSGAAVLPIPREIAAQLPKSGKARIIVLTNDATDEAEWRAGAYEQFLRDDSAEDAIYDSLR
jgi:hypothetical protein